MSLPTSAAAVPATPAVVAPSPLLREVFATRQVYNERGETVELDGNVSEAETALLHGAVSEIRPRLSVEIGFAEGISTLAILDALRQNGVGRHHTIDPFQANYGYCGRAMVKRAGLDEWYEFHEKFADEVIPGLGALQFAFIDSSHLFDLTMGEFALVDRRLDVGGVVGFHDMYMPAQQQFMRYVLANRAYEVWQPAGWPRPAPGRGSGLKEAVRAGLKRLPGAERWLSREFLKPWNEFGLSNLVLLRKTAPDRRDWQHHVAF